MPTAPAGPSPGYPNGYASYSNAAGQAINPLTGQTVGKSSPWWHALTHPSAKIDKPASRGAPAGGANGARAVPSLAVEGEALLDPRALEALAAVVDGDVRPSGAAELCDGAAELMASLAHEDEEG